MISGHASGRAISRRLGSDSLGFAYGFDVEGDFDFALRGAATRP